MSIRSTARCLFSVLVLAGAAFVPAAVAGAGPLGSRWTHVATTAQPLARNGAVMAADGATGQLVLFGGGADNQNGVLNDTWTWSGTNWVALSPATSPPARGSAAMAYDPA